MQQAYPPNLGTHTGAPTHTASVGIMPEFLRIKDAVRLFSIGKSTLCDWIAKGWVKSHLIRRPGNISGIRVVSTAHLRDFIAGHTAE